ncbi:PLP-dependent transferase [Xylariaceae sp. AK1471]|nr:PLP-dependent transferase [Xylariaceae sp. AK1471]
MSSIVDMGSLEATLQSRLAQRESQGRLRQLKTPRSDLVDFSSNDYLSLSQDLVVRNALVAHLNDQDKSTSNTSSSNERMIGSGGSRLLDGNSAFAEQLERKISSFHCSEAALLFNSAFDANVGLISCVPRAEDVILYDNLIHASIHDGMRLSRATKMIPFAHSSIIRHNRGPSVELEKDSVNLTAANGFQGLETALKQLVQSDSQIRSGRSNIFICVEALYSMDGDIAQLEKVCDVVETLLPKQNGYIIVDEAHSIGVLGDSGRGLVCQLGLEDRVWARVVGFGKAMGCAGGAVLCSPVLRLYLINYARTLIYTTAMSFPSLASINSVYDYVINGKAEKRLRQLETIIQHCHVQLQSLHQRLKPPASILHAPWGSSSSPIIPLFTTHPKSLARHCQNSGFMIRPIVAPTVPQGQERIRICLHAANTIEQVNGLCQAIEAWLSHLRAGQNAETQNGSQTGVTPEADLQGGLSESIKARL